MRVNRVTDQLQPELAESWKLSDGGRTITFHLRAGLKFSNGAPLTANDVARTFNTALDPKTAAPVGRHFPIRAEPPRSPRRVAARCDHPLRSTEAGNRSLVRCAFHRPPDSRQTARFRRTLLCFEYQPGDYVRLARNPNYWKHDAAGKQLPYLDSIRLDIQPNRDIELTRFLRGEIQFVDKLDPANFDRVVERPNRPQPETSARRSIPSSCGSINRLRPAFPTGSESGSLPVVFRHAVSMSISPRRSRPHRLSRSRARGDRARLAGQSILVQWHTQTASLRFRTPRCVRSRPKALPCVKTHSAIAAVTPSNSP